MVDLGVAGVFLLAPLCVYDPSVTFSNTAIYSLNGIPGAASGLCIRWSCTRGRSLLFGISALVLAVAHILLLNPGFLGVGHLFGPLALVLLFLSVWNLHRIIVDELR